MREVDAVEDVAAFDNLKIFDDAFALQVLKELQHSVANVHFSFAVGFFDT